MGSVFVIEELRRVGGLTMGTKDGGERFEWTSGSTPIDAQRGGARACPKQPWVQPGELRTVRTDYPGARTPSVQVLGPKHGDHVFMGRWDDRYNFDGYATQEKARFESMCRRGNLVRLQMGAEVIEGLITSWEFTWRRAWDCDYTFTVSVHDRPSDFALDDRAPQTVLSASALLDRVDIAVQAAQAAQDVAPIRFMASDAAAAAEAALADVGVRRDELGATLEQREILPSEKPTDAFVRLATQFRIVAASAFGAVTGLYEVRSDIDLAVHTAMSVLDFEDWSRSVRFTGRVLLGNALSSGAEVEERAEPAAVRLYRPAEGESLYAISRRFYGTPHAWRLIADRNGLDSLGELTGDELLIIPERAA